MIGDLPHITGSKLSTTTNTIGLAQFGLAQGNFIAEDDVRSVRTRRLLNQIRQNEEVPMATVTKRRLVQVFIADPNEHVPLGDSLLYSGSQKLTDATDQELFFELEIKSLLDQHNIKRVNMVNKSIK